jgi:hypothetical protein
MKQNGLSKAAMAMRIKAQSHSVRLSRACKFSIIHHVIYSSSMFDWHQDVSERNRRDVSEDFR